MSRPLTVPIYENNIPQSTIKVNSDTLKYSMQENEKDTQENK